MPDTKLHGSTESISLDGGYSLRSPGLRGTARLLGLRAAGSPGPEMATDEFDRAFADAGIQETATIELEVYAAPLPAAALRGPGGADSFELSVPDLGPDLGQVVLSIDEAGALHWL